MENADVEHQPLKVPREQSAPLCTARSKRVTIILLCVLGVAACIAVAVVLTRPTESFWRQRRVSCVIYFFSNKPH